MYNVFDSRTLRTRLIQIDSPVMAREAKKRSYAAKIFYTKILYPSHISHIFKFFQEEKS